VRAERKSDAGHAGKKEPAFVSTLKQKLKPRNTQNFTKGMGFDAVLVSPFWRSHKIPHWFLISWCFVTFVVPSSESELNAKVPAARESGATAG
jgi:hypothetical protein